MTGDSELKLEGRKGDAQKDAMGRGGKEDPGAIPILSGTRAVGENTA